MTSMNCCSRKLRRPIDRSSSMVRETHSRKQHLLELVGLPPDSAQEIEVYLWIRHEPPCANARTWSRVAMVVSPGNVVSSAQCPQPSRTASSGDSPANRP